MPRIQCQHNQHTINIWTSDAGRKSLAMAAPVTKLPLSAAAADCNRFSHRVYTALRDQTETQRGCGGNHTRARLSDTAVCAGQKGAAQLHKT